MKKIFILLMASFVAFFSSCDDYLDINYDPNNPSEEDLTVGLILPAVEMNLAAAYGNYLRTVGGYFAQHYAQCFGTSNYMGYSKFEMKASFSDEVLYKQLYLRVISTGQSILEKAEKNEDWGSYLAATVLRSYAFAAMVDCYDSIPYSECLVGITQPKYDGGRDIYDGIIAEIDNALSKVSENSSVETNFLFPNQKAIMWIRFANALKLKLYTRLSNIDNSVQDKIAALLDSELPIEDIAFKNCWTTSSGSESPFFAEEFATNFGSNSINIIANIAIVGTMVQPSYTDPRIEKFFNKNDQGSYMGGVSGSNFNTFQGIYGSASFCRPNVKYDEPVSLISLAEIEFFKAEYYARKNDAGNAKIHYENAITESFKSAGVDGAEENIAFFPYDQSNWRKSIGVSKWIALAGVDNYEAWCELRRLRYPNMSEVVGDVICQEGAQMYNPEKYVPGTLYTPINVFVNVGKGKILERFPASEASVLVNANAPKQTDRIYTTPVFWAKQQ